MKILFIAAFFILICFYSKAQTQDPKLPIFCSANYEKKTLNNQLVSVYWQPATDSSIVAYWIKGYKQGKYYAIKQVNGREVNFTTFIHNWDIWDRFFSIFSVDNLGNEFSDSSLFTTIWYSQTTIMSSVLVGFTAIDFKDRFYQYRWSSDSIVWNDIKTYNLSALTDGQFSYKTYPPDQIRPAGWYQVVTFNNACVEHNASYNNELVTYPNAIQENQSFSKISHYPNPSNGTIFFNIPQEFNGRNIKVQLINILGDVIAEANVSNLRPTFYVNTFCEFKGMYFLRIADEQTLRKIIFIQ